jgi:16S rRNA (uracil1498-N3)-methyltransferase
MSGGINCEEKACRHMVSVLRLQVGDEIEIVERDDWRAWRCRLDSTVLGKVSVTVLEALPAAAPPFATTLLFGLAKGDKNERIVRQATELGVACLMPVIFERSVSRPDPKRAANKVARLRAVAASAAQQAHRADVPKVEELLPFATVLGRLRESKPDLLLVPWEEEAAQPLSQSIDASTLPPHPRVTLVVGPEGGISAEEIDALRQLGARAASLGATILRVDTAACAALAILHNTLNARR